MVDLLVPVIEPTALQEARNLARGSAAITIPAPTGGLNRREAEADMPLDQATREASDAGTPITESAPESETAVAFMAIAERVAARCSVQSFMKETS